MRSDEVIAAETIDTAMSAQFEPRPSHVLVD